MATRKRTRHWVKLHHTTPSDPAVRALTSLLGCRHKAMSAFTHLLLHVSERGNEGRLSGENTPLKIAMDLYDESVTNEELLEALEAVGFLQDSTIVDWPTRYDGISDSAARVKRHRNVTLCNTKKHNVTLSNTKKHNVTLCNQRNLDGDVDGEGDGDGEPHLKVGECEGVNESEWGSHIVECMDYYIGKTRRNSTYSRTRSRYKKVADLVDHFGVDWFKEQCDLVAANQWYNRHGKTKLEDQPFRSVASALAFRDNRAKYDKGGGVDPESLAKAALGG